MLTSPPLLYLSPVVVAAATIIALATDLKRRMIYNHLTAPLFLLGLIYSLYNLSPHFDSINTWDILRAWLGPILFVFVYSLLLFWLGILAGGDGQFLIAITPWLGAQQIVEVILYFYPAAFLYLAYYLLQENGFSFKQMALQQWRDMVTLIKSVPVIIRNIKSGEEHVLVKNIPYESKTAIPPAGMVPISISVLLSYLI